MKAEISPKAQALKEEVKLLLSTREAAKYIGVSETKFRELVNMKDSPIPTLHIPYVRYPRYSRKSLDKYIEDIECQVLGVINI